MQTFQRVVGKTGVSWRARVIMGRNARGKMIRKSAAFGCKRDADEGVAKMETRASTHPAAATHLRITLNVFVLEHWLPFHRTRCAPSSYVKREAAFQFHVLPVLSGMRLQDVTPRHVHDL